MSLRIFRIFLALILIFGTSGYAQNNLVPNGSFESITQCPSNCIGATTSTLAVGWINPNNGSADLYSPCDMQICTGWNIPCNGEPSNCAGWQNARTGINYTGIAVYGADQSNAREYLEIRMSDSLRQNTPYCVSFYASLADSLTGYATSRLGAYFSKNVTANFSQFLINANPQVQNSIGNFVSNNQAWYNIRGIFYAAGGEQYITLGNFFDDSVTDTIRVSGASYWQPGSYYFIDEVSVVKYSPAKLGPDTTICRGIKIRPVENSSYGAQFNWIVLNGDFQGIDSNHIASPSLTPSITTTYVLQKTQCGIATYDTLLVNIPATLPALIGNDSAICLGDTIVLKAVNNCLWCTHGWSTGSSQLQISIEPQVTSTYSFWQSDSCFTTMDALTINVNYCESPLLIAPNIFTPNGDGINEAWLPQIKNELSADGYSLKVYDRWGIKVFESDKSKNGWDGRTTAGQECVEGTYYYVIECKDLKTSQGIVSKGFLQLSK